MGLVKIHGILLSWIIYIIDRNAGFNMRHKWAKMQGGDFIRESDSDVYKHRVTDCRMCVNCDLRKGSVKTLSNWPILIYYKDNVVLSKMTLPYPCNNINEMKSSLLFSEKEFEI